MSCGGVRRRFSAHRDGGLPRREAQRVVAHLAACPSCSADWSAFSRALDTLAASDRLASREGIAPRVLARLEVESRGPGLALLFRPVWAARPLIVPSLIPAALVLVTVVAAALFLDSGPLPPVARASLPAWERGPAWGTEGNPLIPVAGVSAPRARGAALPPELLETLGDQTLFVETVVGRDGTVTAVNLLQGDREVAHELLERLRRTRFEPARFNGRPVAVSVYRLISSLEVRAHAT
jgi:hypothetical protein